MSSQFQFAQWLSEIIEILGGSHLEAQQTKLKAIAEFRKQEKIHDLHSRQELKKLEIQFDEQLKRVQERETRITEDYRQFLNSIDEMKTQIVESFPDMPKVMALIIHQHAKQLVDKMWNESTDKQVQGEFQAQLASFLSLVFDDTARILADETMPKIPSKTLAYLEKYARESQSGNHLPRFN